MQMTLRRLIGTTSLAAAISLGAVGIAPASAAPAAPAYTVVGKDGLAVYADAAMNAWLRFTAYRKPADLAEFDRIRDALALEAARRLGADGARMVAAWRSADRSHQVALMSAMTQLGTPYRRNTSKPGSGFDCSGLTLWAWAQSGADLPRNSRSQINHVARVSRDQAQAGDLVYYPGHISIYLGVDNYILHAPFTGRSVEFSHIKSSRANSVLFGNPAA